MNVIKNNFGDTFVIASPQEGSDPGAIESVNFHDPLSAKRFVASLNVTHDFWLRYFNATGLSNPNIRNHNDVLEQVSLMLLRRRFKVFKLPMYSSQSPPIADRTIKTKYGQQLAFLSAGEALLYKKVPSKTFNSEQDAKKFVDALNLTDEQLTAFVKAASNSKSELSDDGKRRVLIKSLLAKDMIVSQISSRGRSDKSGDTVDNTANIPGNRPVVTPASGSQNTVATAAKVNRDAEQAEALIKASESGDAFCEDCAAVDEED